ncbi:MAG: hypothetical protein EAY65_00890 [Alphaproteobacteria bacterium]|nr:MAG: hypothetical protein EAY65_00890 [Alphaproteobacteria bacterium]
MTEYDNAAHHQELNAIHMMLDKIPVPESIRLTHSFEGKSHDIILKRIGFNPAMALNVFRSFGFAGIQHSAPTVYFWNVMGAPKEVCNDFKAQHGDRIFDLVQQSMKLRRLNS